MTIALTREVSPAIARCELTHLDREPIALDRARQQHLAYQAALRSLGCEVTTLPALPELPDSVFVEDTAIVLDELAVLMRPGATSRRPETDAIGETLCRHRDVVSLAAPGTLDGGDVLAIGRELFVGRSSRSNEEGARALAELVGPVGYSVHEVELEGCLHLKSAVTRVSESTLLVNPDWIDVRALEGHADECIEVAPTEPFAANALLIGESVIYPISFPETRARLERRGISVTGVDVSELQKAEGGVTCCSLLVAGTR